MFPLLTPCVEGVSPCVVPTSNLVLSWAILLVGLTASAIGFMTGMPVVQLMLCNVADPRIQGLTQGAAQSVASLLRALGPFASGLIFSYFAAHAQPYYMCLILGVCYGLCTLLAIRLKAEEVDAPPPVR